MQSVLTGTTLINFRPKVNKMNYLTSAEEQSWLPYYLTKK